MRVEGVEDIYTHPSCRISNVPFLIYRYIVSSTIFSLFSFSANKKWKKQFFIILFFVIDMHHNRYYDAAKIYNMYIYMLYIYIHVYIYSSKKQDTNNKKN